MPIDDPVPLDQRIVQEQVRLIYNQGTVLIVGASLCALLFVVFLWRLVPQESLLYWLLGIFITMVMRLWVIRAFHRRHAHPA